MFKPILKNTEEIMNFINEFASEPIDEELVREYFYGCKAILKIVLVHSLKQGNEDYHIKNFEKEKRYELLPFETMPPLIIENDKVIDGNHRLRIAKKKHIKKINVYEIISL